MDVAEINESWFDEQAQAESLDRIYATRFYLP